MSSTDKPKEQRSLFGEILDWMLSPLLLLWPMSLALTGVVAEGIANRPYDRELGERARLLARQVQISPGTSAKDPPLVLKVAGVGALNLLSADDADRVYFQVLGPAGELITGDRDLPTPDLDPAFEGQVQYRDDQMKEEAVRVAAVRTSLRDLMAANLLRTPELPEVLADPTDARLNLALDGLVTVQFAETLNKRSRLTTEIIKGVILPQFLVLPLAVLLVWLALARGIRPLNELQQRIRERDSQDLSPIDDREAPEEVAPLVTSINDLLERLGQSVQTQKHFLADAAHQLKTPLAGLRMQAELALREFHSGVSDPKALTDTLTKISLSSQRATHAVNQLLSMARAEDQAVLNRRVEVDMAQVMQDAVADLFPKAMDKEIDIGYEGSDGGPEATLLGQPVLLGEMVRNLIDNALQYTPRGGRVTARVLPDPFGEVLVVQVEDSGPGIPEAERELVLQPFYRALGTGVDGTGLGLAIVQEVVKGHNGVLSIGSGQVSPHLPGAGPGALFTIRLPLRD